MKRVESTVTDLTEKIEKISNEKEKLEEVIKNLLFEKEVQKLMQTGTSSHIHQDSPEKAYSPSSPKFKESSIINAVRDYNRIELKHDHHSSYAGSDSKIHTPEKHNKSINMEDASLPNYGEYMASIKQGGSSLNKPIDSHISSQASSQTKDVQFDKHETSNNNRSRHSPLRNPPPAQATLNLSNLQNFNSKTITIVHPASTSRAQNTLKNNPHTPQNNFINRLNEVQGSASSKITHSDLPTSILGNTMSSQISVVSPNTVSSGYGFRNDNNRNQTENPILIQQNPHPKEKPAGHRPTMSFNKDYEINQFANVSPAVLEIINNYRVSKNNSPAKSRQEGNLSQSNSQKFITNPSVFSIGAEVNSKSTEPYKETDIPLISDDIRISDPQYTHINFERIEKRKSIANLEETNLTPSHYNPSPNIRNNQPLDRFRGPLLGSRNQGNPSNHQFNYSITENSQLVRLR